MKVEKLGVQFSWLHHMMEMRLQAMKVIRIRGKLARYLWNFNQQRVELWRLNLVWKVKMLSSNQASESEVELPILEKQRLDFSFKEKCG